MDWFESLMGFREDGYDETQRKLEVDGRQLRSRVNGKSYGIGELELVTLGDLRDRVQSAPLLPQGHLKVSVVCGDVRRLHQSPELRGALFQVASQFNLLEMVSPEVTPEHGVTRYQFDRTQGPACAIAAGAGTVYRNYCVPVGGQIGQTSGRQLDGLADLGAALSASLGLRVEELWAMQNGYALCHQTGLEAIAEHLASVTSEEMDALRANLRIGVHRDVEVTDMGASHRPIVSQAFCSALPVAYSHVPRRYWGAFATLTLEAAYEATIWAAVANAQRGASSIVLLTRLGGGAFGNDDRWIDAAIRRALMTAKDFDLDVRIVSFKAPSRETIQMVEEFG